MPERDGIASGMMLLELLATERLSVNQLLKRLEKQFGPHHYARLDTHFPLEKRAALMEFCKTNTPAKLAGSPVSAVKSFDGVKFIAENGAWLMLRGSGTEPILRIYAEATSGAAAKKLIADGVKITKRV
jgi:phosphomannomutase